MTAFAPDVGSKGRPFVFIVAGEPSGDALGARLMEALRRRSCGHARFAVLLGNKRRAGGGTGQLAREALVREPGDIRRPRLLNAGHAGDAHGRIAAHRSPHPLGDLRERM